MYAGRVACCPLVSHVEYAPRALFKIRKNMRQTDERTPHSHITLIAKHRQRSKDFMLTLTLTRLFCSYCTRFYGCESSDLSCDVIMHFCTAWRKGIRRVFNLSYQTHCYLLPLLSDCLPVFDKICSRSMNFVSTCLSHRPTSRRIRYVDHHSITFGLNFSPFGRNILAIC